MLIVWLSSEIATSPELGRKYGKKLPSHTCATCCENPRTSLAGEKNGSIKFENNNTNSAGHSGAEDEQLRKKNKKVSKALSSKIPKKITK